MALDVSGTTYVLCCSSLLSDDALVALSAPPVLPCRSFWSIFLMPHSEILTGATTCFEDLFLVLLFSPEELLDSIDVVNRMGVDLCEIFQQKMQWLLSAGFVIFFSFFLT